MKHFVVLLAAMTFLTAVPVDAGQKSITLDAAALRESVVSLNYEWASPGPMSTNLKLAVGKNRVEDADMSLAGMAIGKRRYVYGLGHPSVGIYAGGYLFGQSIATSVLEIPEDGEAPNEQSLVAAHRFTERRTSVGLMSGIGLKYQATKNLTIDVGPEVTVPFIIYRTNTDGQKETQRFPSIAYNWRLGVGYSW